MSHQTESNVTEELADSLGKLPVAMSVVMDEPAYALHEVTSKEPTGEDWTRYQVIIVNRRDKRAAFWRKLGPALEMTTPLFNIFAMWEHSVAELQEMADMNRDDTTFQQTLDEVVENSTMIDRYIDQSLELVEWVKGRSFSGPTQTTQRSRILRRE